MDRIHPGIVFLTASLAAGICGCGGGERVLTPEEQIRELTFQRDRALTSLEESLEALNKTRGTLGAVLSEKTQLHSDLEKERAGAAELRTTVEQAGKDKAALDEQLQSSRKDFARLKDTHEKLEQLGRRNLEELSELRQRMAASNSDRSRIEQIALTRNRQIDDLNKEIEKLQSSLVEEQAVSETLRKRLSISIAVNEGPDAREASPQSLVNDFLTIFTVRIKKAFQGEVAWDAFDITVVSALGSILIVLVVGWFLLVRVRRLRRRLKQYQLTVKRPPARAGAEEEAGENDAEEDAAEVAQAKSKTAASLKQEADWLSKTQALRPIRRATPNFSPIVRAESLRQGESGAEVETDNAAERTQFIPLTGVRGAAEPAAEPRQTHREATPPPAPRPAPAQRASEGKPAPAKKGKAPESPRDPSAGGDDEQDILKELKQIIDKKFNQVMDD